jgi:hypothetical protein
MSLFPLTRLIGNEFHGSYAATVTRIAERLNAHANVQYDQLEFAHEAWKNEVNRHLQTKELSPKELWTYVLATLAKNLCNVDCVSYSIAENEESDAAIIDVRLLLIHYPNQYTALEFTRSQYLEIYFLAHNISVLNDSIFQPLDLSVLRKILQAIKHNPNLAENYVSLLHLPVD